MTIHSRAEELFAAEIDFDLTPAEHVEVADHLATCAACRTLASGYRADASALREIAFAQPPAWLQTAVLAAAERPLSRTIRPWKVLVAAALLAGLTIAGVVIGSLLLRHATPLAGGPLVVYEIRGTFADVYTLDVISGTRTPHGSVQVHAPIGGQRIRWAADGRSAFVFGDPEHLEARVDFATGGIVVLDLLTLDGQQDEVSPTGDRVARLLGDAERGMRISVVDLSGVELVNLALPTGVIAYSGIGWAPDASSLLLSGCLPCDLKGSPSPANVNHLFVVPLDGGPIRQLTDDSTGTFNSARFSPDGSTVAYSTVHCHDACTGGIATVRVADGSVTRLTTSGPDTAPAWSPDGERIAFQRGGGDGGIYVMDRDGTDMIRLTAASPDLVDRDRAPVWSPDAAWIAFTRDVSDTSIGDLWIVPSDGGEARLLAQNAVADWGPTTKMMALVSPAPTMASQSAPPSVGPRESASTSPPAAPEPIPLDDGRLLVHQIDGTSPADAHTQSVYLVDIGTGERTTLGTLALTEATCCPENVQWSSDRRRAFLSSELGVNGIVDLDAGSVQAGAAAPPGQFKAAISRAGDRIARVDQVSGKSETIVISDLAGHEESRLRVPKDRHVEELVWSPDDGSLGVIGQRYPGGDPELAVTYLFVVPLDGSPGRDLADNAAEMAGAPAPQARESRSSGYLGAAWSPDGRTIALADQSCVSGKTTRIVNGVEATRRYACTGRLLTLDAMSGAQTVTLSGDDVPGPPTWSPDGRRLAFAQFGGAGDVADAPNCYPCERRGVFVMDRDGGNLTRLADGDGPARWSPDGAWLAFPRYDWDMPEGLYRSEVWIVPVAGGEPKLIAKPAAAGW